MIIPRHKICDLCGKQVGVNVRYFVIKSKCLYVGYAGSCHDNQKHHICEGCMTEIRSAILNGSLPENESGEEE